MKEWWEEANQSLNFPSPERHKANLSLTCLKKADNWIRATVILRQPFFADYGAKAGSEARRETGEPEAVDCDRETGGLKGSGWVRHAR